MELPSQGKAPVLNYNLTTKTAFEAYANQLIPIPSDYFLRTGIKTSSSSVESMSQTDIKNQLTTEESNQTNTSKLIVNIDKLHKKPIASTADTKTLGDIPNSGENTKSSTATVSNTSQKSINKDDAKYIFNDLGVDIDFVVQKIKDGYVPIIVDTFGGFKKRIKFIKQVKDTPNPTISIIQEYKTVSYLGDYGAGKTVKTMSLLPGEKTTITIKTFTESIETKKRAENIMDSFSENSASNFEDTLKEQTDTTEASSENTTNTDHLKKSASTTISLSLSGVISGIMAHVNASTAFSKEYSHNSVCDSKTSMETATSNLHEAVEKHTNSTNSSREVNINNKSSSSETDRKEKSIVRQIFNPNLNRVLNFVFRQLQQEYITVTYLNDIKIFFTNGNPESNYIVPVNELDILLNAVLKEEYRPQIKSFVINEYEYVDNYKGKELKFLEQVTYDRPILDTTEKSKAIKPKTTYIYKKNPDLIDTYDLGEDNDLKIEVSGVILKVAKNTLRTPAVVVDALMGKGDALDCYNQIQQEAKTKKLDFENAKLEAQIAQIDFEKQKMQQVLTMISALPNEQKVEALKAVFGKYGSDNDVVITNN